MGFNGSHLAVTAAHRRRRRQYLEEEERMTKYSPTDLGEDWEFKIVRAETPVFRKPEVFQQLLQEEAAAGWQLVEKLDDMRVRFKRPAAVRKRDAMLPAGVDPYRTRFGRSTRAVSLVIVLMTLVIGVAVSIIPAFLEGGLAKFDMIILGSVVLIFLLIMVLVLMRFRR